MSVFIKVFRHTLLLPHSTMATKTTIMFHSTFIARSLAVVSIYALCSLGSWLKNTRLATRQKYRIDIGVAVTIITPRAIQIYLLSYLKWKWNIRASILTAGVSVLVEQRSTATDAADTASIDVITYVIRTTRRAQRHRCSCQYIQLTYCYYYQSINQSILFYCGMAERRPTICTNKNKNTI